MGLLAGIKVAVNVGKKVAKVIPVARRVLSKNEPDPTTKDLTTPEERAMADVAKLWRSFTSKHSDGKWEPQEAMMFLSELLTVVSKYV